MKAKAIAAFLCLLLTIPMLGGCGKQAEPESAVSAGESQAVSAEGIPEDVQQTLQAALDAEPITIPAEEWTVDTICQATYINGKNLSIPCTLRDFGEGFEVCETEDFPYTVLERLNGATCSISY